MTSSIDTTAQLRAQWMNPSDVSALLMIIGGGVVRTALAQSAGTHFTPVCFSFGWVAYAFTALVGVLGGGRLLPRPDYPAKVFNLSSGHAHENRNWGVGRIVRDHEAATGRRERCDEGIRISIFDAVSNPNTWTRFSYGWMHVFGLASITAQLVIAAIPIILSRDWGVMLITGAGTVLALAHGGLPQWVAEKLPNRQHADSIFGLTSGDGSKDIMIIQGHGKCLNLEELAVPDSPRNGRPWEKFSKRALANSRGDPEGSGFHRVGLLPRQATNLCGFPVGFWITLLMTAAQSAAWLMLLITVASLETNAWFLFAVGALGLCHNAIIGAMERPPESRNLPLRLKNVITRRKAMDGLMELELALKCARPFVKEFFPGGTSEEETEWWEGNREPYDRKRRQQQRSRGLSGGGPNLRSLSELDKNGHAKEKQAALSPPSVGLPADCSIDASMKLAMADPSWYQRASRPEQPADTPGCAESSSKCPQDMAVNTPDLGQVPMRQLDSEMDWCSPGISPAWD